MLLEVELDMRMEVTRCATITTSIFSPFAVSEISKLFQMLIFEFHLSIIFRSAIYSFYGVCRKITFSCLSLHGRLTAYHLYTTTNSKVCIVCNERHCKPNRMKVSLTKPINKVRIAPVLLLEYAF